MNAIYFPFTEGLKLSKHWKVTEVRHDIADDLKTSCLVIECNSSKLDTYQKVCQINWRVEKNRFITIVKAEVYELSDPLHREKLPTGTIEKLREGLVNHLEFSEGMRDGSIAVCLF